MLGAVWARPLVLLSLTALITFGPGAASAQSREPLIDRGRIIGGSTKQLRDVRPVRGFLPKPGLLRPGTAGQAALVYLNPAANFPSYKKIMLDRVVIYTTADSQLNKAPQGQRQAVATKFYANLYNALKQRCQMVQKASPGTLRLRVALTDATRPNAAVNTVATFAPYVSTAYSVGSAALNKGVGYFAGTASVEGYAVDAAKGTLLWQAVDKRGGTTALVANTLDSWRDANNAIEAWSSKIAARLRELGACQ